MMPTDSEGARALALAQSAMTVAEDARREAAEAKDGLRSIYIALGDLTRELRRLAAAHEVLAEQLARLHPRSLPPPPMPMRDRAPSVHDIAVEVATAVVEKTGSRVTPSQRVVSIFEREKNKNIVAGVTRVLVVLLPLLAGALFGHLAWH